MTGRIPKSAFESKTVRCLWILKYLSEGPIHSTELAVLFSTSERGIQRDIATLKNAGAPIETSLRGYVLKASCVMPF